jgi:hypothetical protein
MFMLSVSCASAVLFALPAGAQQSNFSITPPPIAAPTFEKDEKNVKVRGTYLSLEGQGVELSGGGVDMVMRKAFSDTVAGNFSIGMFLLDGDMDFGTGKADLTILSEVFGLNIEVQPVKTERVNLILFGGPTFDFSQGSMETSVTVLTNTISDTLTITTVMFGYLAGAQFGLNLGDFNISPFAMMTSKSGSSTVSSSFGGDTETDIPTFTTTSYGFDIAYVPWNLTLSSVLQEAAKQGEENPGFKTTIYQLAWTKKF